MDKEAAESGGVTMDVLPAREGTRMVIGGRRISKAGEDLVMAEYLLTSGLAARGER
jgi:hypothetical protein